MATQIGVITALIGTATVTALDGTVRQLQLGDKVYANDLITTGAGSAIEVEFADGSVMDMGRDSQTVLNNEVYDPSAAAHNVAQADANVDAIQQAILAGQDPSKVASPTAAGNGDTANGDQVHSPVYVDYLNPEVTPDSGFGTTGPTNTFFQAPGDSGYNTSLVLATTSTPTTPENAASQLIVGSNASDNTESSTPYVVSTSNPNTGVINGNTSGDILVGDTGGVATNTEAQNYNVALVLDTSLSLSANSDLATYKASVISYLNELHSYQHGNVSVGIVTFAHTASSALTFDVSTDSGLQNAINFVNGITLGSQTNYEAALSSAANWLSSVSDSSIINQTVFVSDGQPNQAIDANGNVITIYNNIERMIGEITGTYVSAHPGSHDRFGGLDASDSHSEVGALQALGHVYAIGIGVAAGTDDASILNVVASNDYISIDDMNSLGSTMMSLSPTQTLDGLGSDVINGGAGDDIIFGDSLNTDALAHAQGLTTPSGDGWDVFTHLENGEGSTSNWTRADTIEYIQTHNQELAQESLNADSSGRVGGNDQLYGGQGNDIIYGQEGNDIIRGGAGNDIMSGGSGNDTFTWAANDAGTISAPAQDTITDFSNGDVLNIGDLLTGEESGDITNYLKVSESGSDVVINVSPDGSGSTGVTENIVLQNTSLADLGAGSFNAATQQSEIINSLINHGHISVDHS